MVPRWVEWVVGGSCARAWNAGLGKRQDLGGNWALVRCRVGWSGWQVVGVHVRRVPCDVQMAQIGNAAGN